MALKDDRAVSSVVDGLGILRCLPEEMRLKVFESLVPDRLPVGTRIPLSPDIQGARKALHSVCLTSKKCYDLALPFLYRHVIITEATQMPSLLATLISNQERQAWIHRFAILVDIPSGGFDEKAMNLYLHFTTKTISRMVEFEPWNLEGHGLYSFNSLGGYLYQFKREIQSMASASYLNSGRNVSSIIERQISDLQSRCLELLFQMETNIEDIFMVFLPHIHYPICPMPLHWTIMDQFRLDPTRPCPEFPLKNLVSIREESARRQPYELRPGPLGPEYMVSKQWEFFQDNGNWFFTNYLDGQGWPCPGPPPKYLAIFSHVTNLGLYRSQTHPAHLRVVLSSCTSLKVLCYTTYPPMWVKSVRPVPPTDEDEGIPVPTLQQALDEARSTLEELQLGWTGHGNELTADEEEIVARNRVDISDFPHLTRAEIDPVFDATRVSESP